MELSLGAHGHLAQVCSSTSTHGALEPPKLWAGTPGFKHLSGACKPDTSQECREASPWCGPILLVQQPQEWTHAPRDTGSPPGLTPVMRDPFCLHQHGFVFFSISFIRSQRAVVARHTVKGVAQTHLSGSRLASWRMLSYLGLSGQNTPQSPCRGRVWLVSPKVFLLFNFIVELRA